jgi:signal transduction histidine kinase/DNA-binding response OmpR family regulator
MISPTMKIRKVLVVDNNATIVELVSLHLLNAGFEVVKAYDGLQALDCLVQAEHLPDAILLDLIMPRLDGQRLTRFLKQDEVYARIPIIILTGIATEDAGKLLGFGADAYIAKGKIDDAFVSILETFRWLEERTDPAEKRNTILGAEKLFPREMTRELLHIKNHLDTMLSMMDEGVVEIDQDHRILFANPAACRFLASEDHRLFGKDLPAFFQRREEVARFLGDIVCDGSPAPARTLQVPHGDLVIRISFSSLREKGTYCGALVILEDVTAQVRRERSLHELMEAIVRNAPVGLCLLDGTDRILAANPAFAHILRQPEGTSALNTPLGEYLAGTGIAPAALVPARPASPGKTEIRTVEFTTPDLPERVILNVSATRLDTDEGPRLLLLVEDVTEKVAMERDLRRVNEELAKANRTKSTFLSMVSHELRTPLSVVRGYLSLILEGKIGPDPDRVQDALRVADKRARHLQHLIEELLDLSRIESGHLSLKRERLDIRKHVIEVVDMFREEQERKKLAIEVNLPADLPPAFADHDKVHQIFTNFVSNAVKFTGEGGRIAITGRTAGHLLEFSITDTGIGIPADKQRRIFDKFYQVDSSDKRLYPGSGLGLAIVKMIVTASGGTIRVESEVEKGSTFTFTLPRVETASAQPDAGADAPEAEAPAADPAQRRSILVVEDDEDILSMIRTLLPDNRYEIIEAQDAIGGLREFYYRRPDLVLADALLPVMSGLELCRIIKTHPTFGKTPVIMLSAAAQEDEIRQGYQVGADAYLVKPFASQDLIEALRRLTS